MGYKRWQQLEALTSDDMNDFLADQVVTVWPSASSRSAGLASPTRGMVSLLTDTMSHEVYYGVDSGWLRPWQLPWGEVGAAQRTTIQSGIGTAWSDLGLAVTAAWRVGRIYRVDAKLLFEKAGAEGSAEVNVADAANAVLDLLCNQKLAALDIKSASLFGRFTVAATGSAAVKLRGKTSAGSLTIRNDAFVAKFTISDDGPAVGAPLT